MATFQKRYYYTFKSIKDIQYTVELWKYTTDTLSATEIRADEQPFKITYPAIKNKFDSIRGSGCDISLLSTTNMKFIDLYTSNMLEYNIRLLSGSTLLWTGYLDSQIYSEPFNEYNNYPVLLTGNDGLALLDRLYFLQSNDSKYTGFDTNWNIIKNILGKLNLSWNKIFIGLSTTSTELTINSGNTILSTTYSNLDNYYDEDDKPMTCREVLETILTPFSAYIQIINGSVYITDVNTIAHSGSTYFRQYNGTTFAYETQTLINLSIGDVSTIKFSNDKQTLNIISPINRQKIVFSPYINPIVIDYDVDKDVFSNIISTTTYGSYPYKWTEKTYSNSKSWNSVYSGLFAELTGLDDNINEKDKYLKLNLVNSEYAYSATLPNIIGTDNLYYLKVEASAYIRTTNDMNNETGKLDVIILQLDSHLSIGDMFYHYESPNYSEWTTDYEKLVWNFNDVTINKDATYKYNSINDKWTDLKGMFVSSKELYIPLWGFSGNTLNFNIGGNYIVYAPDNSNLTSSIKDIRLKDIKLTIVDALKNDVQNVDVEYISYLNKNVKDEGNDITLKLGTNSGKTFINCPSSKGSIIGNNGSYFFIHNFTRNGINNCLEKLLTRSIVSNYSGTTTEIQLSINSINNIFGNLTYNNYLPNKIFGIQSAIIDYYEETLEMNIQELFMDDTNLIDVDVV